jgi:putative heme-binding domain-containing protein
MVQSSEFKCSEFDLRCSMFDVRLSSFGLRISFFPLSCTRGFALSSRPYMKAPTAPRPQRACPAIWPLAFVVALFAQLLQAADPFAENIRRTDPLTPERERDTFHLPPGFEIQLVASEPDIGKPMNMAFDSQGRLWLTQSREYPYAAPLDKPARDMIKVLSDFDQDGRARKITTFADGLNIPIGLYPYKDGVIAFSIPYIYFFQDTDGDGRADKKEVILGRQGFEKDVHGLTSAFRRGYDGWIYADHGYNNDTTLTAKDGSTIKMNSGNTYRFKVDGSRVEQYTWGQVNPFGMMFDPLGDLWSADCHSSPVYQLLRGAYYPSFGKPDDGLGFGPDVCKHSHGSTAIAGMVYYADDQFPPEYRGNTFIGNVMTCRVDRDSLTELGSTRVAKEKPDFLSTDDPWFRPVDLQLGPDGAIYVADFYNRIIGHYEVPLDHPGRDRERGRIWRIWYHGTNTTPVAPRFDLSKASAAQLISEFASPNLTRRMLAMDQLVDRIGTAAVDPVKKLLGGNGATPTQKIHGLWVLHRLGALDESLFSAAAKDADRGVRVHAMRVLSETSAMTATQDQLALAGLRDADPYVERAAADALGQHPASGHVRPLLDLRERARPDDLQLVHVVRMALRNQLQAEGVLAGLLKGGLSDKDSQAIADVALGLKSADSGSFLLQHIEKYPAEREQLTGYLRHIARYAPPGQIGRLASVTRKRCADDLDLQMALFKSIEQGATQRGAAIDPAVLEWGTELAGRLLVSAAPGAQNWRNVPLKGSDSANPWFLQPRASADGDQNSLFLCSLPPGGEKLTGILQSKPFVVPSSLSFFIAGHDGVPARPPSGENLIRLRDVATQQVLAQSAPPRNDIAWPVTWDLKSHAGKQGFLEVVDANTGEAYAWLAVGRFNPPVVPLPTVSPNQVDQRQLAGAELASSLKLAALEPRLATLLAEPSADPDARAAAARALGLIDPERQYPALTRIVSDAEEPANLRAKVGSTLGELNLRETRAVLVAALGATPYSLQRQLALALAGTQEGGEALLQAVADGKASAHLLQERNIRDRLAVVKPENLGERLKKLTANLAPPDQARQKLIDNRRAAFKAGAASVDLGAAVFKQHCAVCHAIDGQGAMIAPQLDGIGGRGLDRVVEDILDPNRNVDRAFRTTLFILNDGDVQSGLFRREEGEMLVLAESTGKEISVAKKDVRERRESETSLMPDNIADIIPPADFNNLLAFLLAHSSKPSTER